MNGLYRASVAADLVVHDLNSVIGEFHNDGNSNDYDLQPIPVQSLSAAFDTVGDNGGDSASAGMKVYLRVRPQPSMDGVATEGTIKVTSASTICTCAPDSSRRSAYTKIDERHYAFTRVFGESTPQSEVFETVAQPLLDRFAAGDDGCVLFACNECTITCIICNVAMI